MEEKPSTGRVLLLLDPALSANPADERLARLIGAVAPLGPSTLLVVGLPSPTLRAALTAWSGVSELIVVTGAEQGLNPLSADWPTENIAALIVSLAGNFSHIVAIASTFGSTLLPRVAALLDRAMVTGVLHICTANTFLRPVLGGNGVARVRAVGEPICLTLQPACFAPAQPVDQPWVPIRYVTPTAEFSLGLSRLLERLPVAQSQRPDLASARVVVAGGGGLVKAGDFALIETLAEILGAAVGASRGAVDAELAPGCWQIGQTGHIIAPDLYIGIGISGAIQHLAGIKDAKTIVAINQDPTAPLMRVADFALVADLHEAVPALITALRSQRPAP